MGDDSILGGHDNDYLSGLVGNDSILGGVGDDTLNGGNDNDYLNGGYENDTLVGGNNADTFVFDRSSGIDTILDFNSNEGDMIEIDMSAYGISSLNNISFNSGTGELSVNSVNIAILQNPVGFAVSNDNISLV